MAPTMMPDHFYVEIPFLEDWYDLRFVPVYQTLLSKVLFSYIVYLKKAHGKSFYVAPSWWLVSQTTGRLLTVFALKTIIGKKSNLNFDKV